MRTVKITHTGVGPTQPVVVDYIGVPTEITWVVNLKGAATTYSIEYTHDDIFNTPAADLYWVGATGGLTFSTNGLISRPIRAIRMAVSLGAATGIDFTINQGVAR